MVSYCKMEQTQRPRHSDINISTKTKNYRYRVNSHLLLLRRNRINHSFFSRIYPLTTRYLVGNKCATCPSWNRSLLGTLVP